LINTIWKVTRRPNPADKNNTNLRDNITTIATEVDKVETNIMSNSIRKRPREISLSLKAAIETLEAPRASILQQLKMDLLAAKKAGSMVSSLSIRACMMMIVLCRY
jgi:hypothetical protein